MGARRYPVTAEKVNLDIFGLSFGDAELAGYELVWENVSQLTPFPTEQSLVEENKATREEGTCVLRPDPKMILDSFLICPLLRWWRRKAKVLEIVLFTFFYSPKLSA